MSDGAQATLILSIVGVVLLLAGLALGTVNGEKKIRAEAIKAGVAHYEVDPVTGVTTFTWNTPKPE